MNYNQNNFNQNDNQNNGWSYGNTPFYNQPPMDDVSMRASKLAASSKTLGILGIVLSIICCPLVGLILGIMAANRAKTAKMMLGYDLPEAKTGRICGIIAILICIASMIFSAIMMAKIYQLFLTLMEEMDMMMALALRFL